jgi:RNA polymerase sigma-70 factor (ECF subfamily)
LAYAAPVEDLEIEDEAPRGEEVVAAAQDRQALADCLGELDARTQQVIRIAFYEGVTYEALAHRLDTPLGTVKSWIRRGLLKLKGCLER